MPYRITRPTWLAALALTACNRAPSAPGVMIFPEEPRTGDDLVVEIVTPAVDPDGDPVTYAFVWSRDGLPEASFFGAWAPASATTKGERWDVVVTPNDGERVGESTTASVTILDSPPYATVVLVPEAPRTDDDVVAETLSTDEDGDPVTLNYVWTVDGVIDPTVSDRLDPAQTSHGEAWTVTVTPNDGEVDGAPVSATVTIGNTAPTVIAVTLVPDAPYVTEDVVAVATTDDIDGDAVTTTYRFFVDDVEVQAGPSDTLPAGAFAKHQAVFVEVTPNDGSADGVPMASADAVALNSAPVAASAAIDASAPVEDGVLTCVPSGYADADGDPEDWQITWTVDGAAVASRPTLTGAWFSKGDAVTCGAAPFDGDEAGAPVLSPTVSIENSPPALEGVALSPIAPTESDTVVAVLGAQTDADGDPVSLRYAWTVDGVGAGSATSLTGSAFSKGDVVVLAVTPNDGVTDGAAAVSAPVTVANAPPSVTSVALSPTTLYTSDTLTAEAIGTDPDGDPVTFLYAWYVDEALVCTAGDSLSGVWAFDKGQDVYVVATPNDGDDDGASASSTAVTVSNTAPEAPEIAITPDAPEPGDALTCEITDGSVDADGDTVTYRFDWDVDGVDYLSAIDAYEESLVDGADVGAEETWSCAAVATDGEEDSAVASASVTTTGGVCEPAYVLGSSSGYAVIDSSDGGDFDFGTALTIAFWLKIPSTGTLELSYILTNGWHHIDCAGLAVAMQADGSLVYGVADGTTSLYCTGGCGSNGQLGFTSPLSRGVWHHIAFVHDGGDVTSYVDGVADLTESCASPIDVMDPAHDLQIGRTRYSTASMNTLQLADLGFWSAALTASNVATLAGYSGAGTALTTDRIARLPLNEGSGTTAADLTGAHPAGIDTAAAVWTTDGPNCP